jgi:kinesin family protein 11
MFLFFLQLQLQSYSEFVSEFVSEQTHKLDQLNSAVQRENSQQQTRMSGHHDALLTTLENQKTLSEQLRASMVAEMDVLIQRSLRQQQEQLGASIALVSKGMETSAESQQAHTDLMHREISGLSSNLSRLTDSTERRATNTTTSIDTMLTQHEKASGEQEESIQRIITELENGVTNMKQMTESHTDNHSTELQSISSTFTNHCQLKENEMEAHVSGVLESCSTLHSSLDSLASSGVSQSATQWTQDTATLSSAISEFTNSQETAIAAAEKSVSHYIAEELAVDVPTGKTPQRRDFSYPQQLAHTRPHTDLLRDFQPCFTLPPLPESDSEEEEVKEEGSTVSEMLPSLDLSQDSSEVESFETTTTSVDSSMSRTDMAADQERKENTVSSRCTPAFSKIPARKKHVAGSRSTGGKKRPLTVKN